MLIDWFTVGAQVLNFLILIYLLKRFLYGPILRAMDRREERIADRLREAAERSEDAGKRAADLERRQSELAERRDAMMKAAEIEADVKRKELLENVRSEAEEARKVWREEISDEKENFIADFTSKAGSEIISLSSRALSDLTGKEGALSMIEVFLDKLGKMEPVERGKIAAGAAKGGHVSMRTRFPLDEETEKKLVERVREIIGFQGEARCTADTGMSPGIELVAGGVRVGWSVEDYFASLSTLLEATIGEAAPGRKRDA
jgi:F-type H+-transporting ATPase subunit b